MLTQDAKTELERQAYRIVGEHSAVKVCGWTKNMIKGKGGCYKLKFYGIMSNQCMQMTTSISCANRCTFCWRGYKAPVSTDWKWDVDDAEYIHKGAIEAHHKLLIGFKKSDKANQKMYEGSNTVKHVALSLTGEPIFYPKINESIEQFNKDGISTFLVTNGQYPEQIKNLKPVTQLYVSVDAPTKELLKDVDVPLFKDYWERLNLSLDYLKEKTERTAIRLTVIKGINDVHLEKYAELVNRGKPDFIEVKAYMHVGQSQERLQKNNMPLHEEVVAFSKKLNSFLEDYEIVSEHIPSRVVMFALKKYNIDGIWNTWIDFEKWANFVNSDEIGDYNKKTPTVGLSGKGTWEGMPDHVRKRWIEENDGMPVFVDEETQEIELD
jgi:tRNA wybutosine-synthesizing protein 1